MPPVFYYEAALLSVERQACPVLGRRVPKDSSLPASISAVSNPALTFPKIFVWRYGQIKDLRRLGDQHHLLVASQNSPSHPEERLSVTPLLILEINLDANLSSWF